MSNTCGEDAIIYHINFADPVNSKCRKLEHPSDNEVPTLSEIRSCLGTSLAQIFFDYTHEEKRKLLGYTIPSKSMKTCFTVSDEPSGDTLDLPTNNEIIKADIHQNILELGQEVLQKFQKETEEKVRERIERRLEEKFYIYQAKKRREVELNTRELHVKYENYIKTVQHELQEKLEVEWAIAVAKCNKNIQKAVVQKRMDVTHEMLQKMRTEIRYVIESLYREFEELFRAKRENMIADFNEIMRREHVKLNERMKEFERKTARSLHIQRHELEMQNTADVIYILCLERLRSNTEKHAIHTYFEKEISGIQNLIVRLNETMNVMKEEIIECHSKRKSLEEQIYEITRHFQSFINFVLHAKPGQAEFLLPLELLRIISPKKDTEEEKSD